MKEENLKNDDLDKAFREGLGDFQVPPPSFSRQEDGSKLDNALRSKLDSFESQPDEENWNKIRRRIPLSLSLQRHLNLWSKIAAVLIVGLATSLLISNYMDYQDTAGTATEVKPNLPILGVDTDLVFDVSTDVDSDSKTDEDGYKNELVEESIADVVDKPAPVEELMKLPAKKIDPIANIDNPLNETLEREGNLGNMPPQMQKPTNEAVLSLTEEESKTASEKQNK